MDARKKKNNAAAPVATTLIIVNEELKTSRKKRPIDSLTWTREKYNQKSTTTCCGTGCSGRRDAGFGLVVGRLRRSFRRLASGCGGGSGKRPDDGRDSSSEGEDAAARVARKKQEKALYLEQGYMDERDILPRRSRKDDRNADDNIAIKGYGRKHSPYRDCLAHCYDDPGDEDTDEDELGKRNGSCGGDNREDADPPTPCWMYKDGRRRYRVGITPDFLYDIFGLSEAEALGLLCENGVCGAVGARQQQLTLASGKEAMLMTVSAPFPCKKSRLGRSQGAWCSRRRQFGESYRKTYPILYTGSCMGKPVRLGLFNIPCTILNDVLGEHYFVPYLRLMPQDFSRSETLSLRAASEAAVLASMLWETGQMNKFDVDVFYYPSVVFSTAGSTPDFLGGGRNSIDSPFCCASFLPGIFVALPQHDLPLDLMREAVLVARRAIESSSTQSR